jgi:8-oxo-dGTP pyrophosphatase MutT (NUDIX family)
MTWSAHVVVACIVERDGKFLLVEERIEANGAAVLNQPAGHWEANETLIEAAKRETLEETGWDVEPTAVLGIYEFKPVELDYTFLRIAFIARALQHHPERKLDHGIIGPLWLTREELLRECTRLRSPSVMRCVDDYLKGQSYPLDMIAHLTTGT